MKKLLIVAMIVAILTGLAAIVACARGECFWASWLGMISVALVICGFVVLYRDRQPVKPGDEIVFMSKYPGPRDGERAKVTEVWKNPPEVGGTTGIGIRFCSDGHCMTIFPDECKIVPPPPKEES